MATTASQEAPAATAAYTYKPPTRAIFGEGDLVSFHKSKTYGDFVAFIRACNDKVRGLAAGDSSCYPITPIPARLAAALEEMETWVDEIPPLQQPMRFGNKAFREWHARLVTRGEALVKELLGMAEAFPHHHHPQALTAAAHELLPYLTAAFGHPTRIDYGTGHESSFLVFLYGLVQLHVISPDDMPALVLRVFKAYLQVMRRLQTDYMLEPAGSHGVWGLDDYHCLVFLFGSAQLIGHPTLSPAAIHSEEALAEHSDDYLYLQQVRFIKQLKHGVPFAESSPMLNDISALPSWTKVNGGMLRLYEGEVLGKLPVIQHFVFGSFFPATWKPQAPTDERHADPEDPYNKSSHTGLESTRAPWLGAARAHPPPLPKSPLQQQLESQAQGKGEGGSSGSP